MNDTTTASFHTQFSWATTAKMKRLAHDDMQDVHPLKRPHIEGLRSIRPTPDRDDAFIDDASLYTTGSTSTVAATTPMTPSSPAHKFPSDLKTIRCTFPNCDKTFNRPARLAAHIRSHNNDRPFKCPHADCDKDYLEEKHLRQHIKGTHTDERKHVCAHPGCDKSFVTATRLRRHQQVHEGQERFRCRDWPPCSQSFRKHQTLERHIRTEHLHLPAYLCKSKDPVTGVVCGIGYDSPANLKSHQDREHAQDRYWCDECSQQRDEDGNHIRVGFATLLLLTAHMKQAHVRCMFCELVCDGREEMEKHVEVHHADQALEEKKKSAVHCTWAGCTKTFSKVSNMNTHIRSAHEGLRFVCGQTVVRKDEIFTVWNPAEGCGEGFATKANLENHIRYVHLKYERPQSYVPTQTKRQDSPNMLDAMTGFGDQTRQTISCTFVDCFMKFAHPSELDAHIQSEHVIDQALLDQLREHDNQMQLNQYDGFDPLADSLNQEPEYTAFWVGDEDGAEPANLEAEEEWIADEAAMRSLIDLEGNLDGREPLQNLEEVLDPSLR
ncbi:hypothetical protein F4778DRAFT_741687 [Xylariomycetidae sp. FL2044]|nr:hypothetical protein F4778DRAFT_741687 [Xylariomycetidae sp. FL2044]